MKSSVSQFSREQIVTFLTSLNDELKEVGVTGELCVVGGAAMVLAFGNRNSTRDIDALVMTPASVREAARRVAEKHGISDTWLNDGAKGFASAERIEARELLNLTHLRVVAPQPEYILAMKCISARVGLDEADKEDAKFLIQHLGLTSAEAVLAITAKYYPASRIPAKSEYFVQEIFDELSSQS